MYGSRPFLMNLLNHREILNIEVNNAFIGTSFDSQKGKAIKINDNKMKRYLNDYEYLELLIDSRKLFRRLQNTSNANIIFLDLLTEGKQTIKINNGVLIENKSLKRCISNIEEAVELPIDKKVKDLDRITDEFISYLTTYDLVIINKLRQPKYKKTLNGLEEKINLNQINFQNYYTESFEDLLLKKMDNVKFIEEYDIPKNLVDGYYYDKHYVEYFIKETQSILKNYNSI